MIRILKYFFYKIYSFSKSNGEKDPGWAHTIVSMFVIANIYTILDVVLIITNSKLPQVSNLLIIAVGALVLYLNYLLLIRDGKPKEIELEFKKTKQSKIVLNLFLIFYIFASVTLFLITSNNVRGMN